MDQNTPGMPNVTATLTARKMVTDPALGPALEYDYLITNSSQLVIDTHLLMVVSGLPAGLRLANPSGMTIGTTPRPYLRVFLGDGLVPTEAIVAKVFIASVDPASGTLPDPATLTPTITYFSGQGVPHI